MLDKDSTVVQQMSETEENIDVTNVANDAKPNPLPGIFYRDLVPFIRAQFKDLKIIPRIKKTDISM